MKKYTGIILSGKYAGETRSWNSRRLYIEEEEGYIAQYFLVDFVDSNGKFYKFWCLTSMKPSFIEQLIQEFINKKTMFKHPASFIKFNKNFEIDCFLHEDDVKHMLDVNKGSLKRLIDNPIVNISLSEEGSGLIDEAFMDKPKKVGRVAGKIPPKRYVKWYSEDHGKWIYIAISNTLFDSHIKDLNKRNKKWKEISKEEFAYSNKNDVCP